MMIRKMTLDDMDQIMLLEETCFSVPWSRESFIAELSKNMLAHYLVIEIEDTIVAYGGVWYVMNEGHITNVAVHPDHRKKGLGKKIVSAMIVNAKNSAIEQMTLEVRRSNEAAIALYTNLGFETAGIRPKYYTDNNEDALIMWINI